MFREEFRRNGSQQSLNHLPLNVASGNGGANSNDWSNANSGDWRNDKSGKNRDWRKDDNLRVETNNEHLLRPIEEMNNGRYKNNSSDNNRSQSRAESTRSVHIQRTYN